MKYLLVICLISLSLSACKDKSTSPEDTGKMIEATYENATVYAGSTDFLFLTADDEEIMVRISNFEEESQISIPKNMLEDPNLIDGPPGMNTSFEGKTFKLYYSERNEVYKIELAAPN
jgi:hypothetical protein